MRFFRLICLSSLVIAITSIALAQQKTASRQNNDVRISKDHPTVYISFVKKAQAEPLYNAESNERVWLKFQNNTR